MEIAKFLSDNFLEHSLFKQALTHRSSSQVHNERLEFLGDAVMQLLISDYLYNRFGNLTEGRLTKMRAHLVRKEMLAEIASELNLGKHLIRGPGENKQASDSVLANAFEAVIGALYLVEGYQAAWQFIEGAFAEELKQLSSTDDFKDPKTRLQEYLQARGEDLPVYKLTEQSNQNHFQVVCNIQTYQIKTLGKGRSKRQAEQQAARSALTELTEKNIE